MLQFLRSLKVKYLNHILIDIKYQWSHTCIRKTATNRYKCSHDDWHCHGSNKCSPQNPNMVVCVEFLLLFSSWIQNSYLFLWSWINGSYWFPWSWSIHITLLITHPLQSIGFNIPLAHRVVKMVSRTKYWFQRSIWFQKFCIRITWTKVSNTVFTFSPRLIKGTWAKTIVEAITTTPTIILTMPFSAAFINTITLYSSTILIFPFNAGPFPPNWRDKFWFKCLIINKPHYKIRVIVSTNIPVIIVKK